MLIGSYYVKFTAKGRIAIPAKFREEIGNKAVIARFYQGCLVVMGLKRWSELLTRLISKSELISEPARDIERFVLGAAFEIEMDKQGRFVVPPVLREYAKIRQEAVFLGLGDRVEVWDRAQWEKREKMIQENALDLMKNTVEKKEVRE